MELLSGSRETMRRGGELWESARKAKSSLWILFDFISKASLSRCFQIRHKESFFVNHFNFLAFHQRRGLKSERVADCASTRGFFSSKVNKISWMFFCLLVSTRCAFLKSAAIKMDS